MSSAEYVPVSAAAIERARSEREKRLKSFPVPVVELVPQASLGEVESSVARWGQGREGLAYMVVRLGYAATPRARNAHVAVLSDAVRTSWFSEQFRTTSAEPTTAAGALLTHVNDVLLADFRAERGWQGFPTDRPAPDVTPASVNARAQVVVDGAPSAAVEIDTDPFVYGIGVDLPTGGVLTAVFPRSVLSTIEIAFRSRRAVDQG